MSYIRFSWAFVVCQYQSLALFLESLVEKEFRLNRRHTLSIIVSTIFFMFFIGLNITHFHCTEASDRPLAELIMQKVVIFYGLIFLSLPTLFVTIRKLRSATLPRILVKQLSLLLAFVIGPYLLFEFLQIYPFNTSSNWITNSYTFLSLSKIFLTYAIYYCSRRIIGLRFLNFNNHVSAPAKFSFMDNLKSTLEQFSLVTNLHELSHITQTFFKETLLIPFNRVSLHIRKIHPHNDNGLTPDRSDRVTSFIESFLTGHDERMCTFIKQSKILIYDEIAFSNFYEEMPDGTISLGFLETINADIFLPIYEKEVMVGYITVDRHARFGEFYSNIERDEMIIFANYLGHIINLLQTRSLEAITLEEKQLKEELYYKHQEINQYKESIRSFLRSSKQKEIGIIFYKNRHFTFGNQASKELIKINVNQQEGHPLSRSLKNIAQQVEEYKSPQTQFSKDVDGNTIIISGVPHLDRNSVIISVYYPEISDIVKKQIDLLKDPTEWDYLLYLETTQTGQLINQLIPGSGETLLTFKINLLKTALNKKAVLLDIPDEDVLPTVELLHHISLRKILHILDLQNPSKNYEIASKLFGINPIFGASKNSEPPLLVKLNDTGTLFIKNIHFLDLETQKYLAEFIRYGFYRVFKSEQKEISNTRIICSTNQDLEILVQEGKFSQALFNELQNTQLTMPSLLALPETELHLLADEFAEQAIQTNTFKNLLSLSPKEKNKLIIMRPTSLQELKKQIQQLLLQKSKENQVYEETTFDPAYEVSDPDLIKAARLGKYALKDRKTMTILWNKFKNQNKIATFLSVNRSSVNRRCKEFNLN
jgi:transcriptional regulator with PAS, ATPase and Fis domain